MQSTAKAGYKNKISSYFIQSFDKEEKERQGRRKSKTYGQGEDKSYEPQTLDGVDAVEAERYAIALQAAWRRRTARVMVSALKQEANCVHHRKTHPELHPIHGNVISECNQCCQGDSDAELKHKINRQKFNEIERLLFLGQKKVTIYDTGNNWNQRFQKIITLPENTQLERSAKYIALDTLNKDFVSTAKTYAKTIISEYFLHAKDKGIICKNMGGVAGGQKYLWRGILFKLADGSFGPFNGSDEAASKAAGHDLKGSIHYSNCGVKELHVPLIALIDYKGFRMSAQAFLPLSKGSMVYGSAAIQDAGDNVLRSNPRFNLAMERAAKELNIRAHIVGQPGRLKELHSAVDVEGHIGMDNRMYLLDLSRTFPPESPSHTKHLNDIYPDGSRVFVNLPAAVDASVSDDSTNPKLHNRYINATVHNAYAHGEYYDLLVEDGSIIRKVASERIFTKGLSIYWRFLRYSSIVSGFFVDNINRPEYVKHRGKDLVPLTADDVELPDIDTKEISPPVDSNVNVESSSTGYNSFSDDYDSLGYDTFDSSDDSNGYDNFSVSKGSLDYDDFFSDVDSLGYDSMSSGSGIEGEIIFSDAFPLDAPTKDLSKAYDEYRLGYASFNHDIHRHLHPSSLSSELNRQQHTSKCPDGISQQLPPRPLSSDALSSFSNADPCAIERNKEIDRATKRLVDDVIPALASKLESMSLYDISNLELAVYFHSHGVNMRHLGLVRHHIRPSHVTNPVRTLLLLQIVTRTLKNIAREYQRRWMKSEQSTSEMGMFFILTQFMNLIVGSSSNSEQFWEERVVVGITQRFGACSLDNDMDHLHFIRKKPEFLKALLRGFLQMIGVTLQDRAMNQFMSDRDPFGFEFIVQDIQSLEPKVKCMHLVDFGTGLMLREVTEEGYNTGRSSLRLLRRMQDLADESFLRAAKAMPSHPETARRVSELKKRRDRDKFFRTPPNSS